MVTPPGGGTSHIAGSSSTKTKMTQMTIVVETRIIWKPMIVDGRVHHILETHNGLMNPSVVVIVAQSCILPLDLIEMGMLSDKQLL